MNLEDTTFLRAIPAEVISNLKRLRILRIFKCGSNWQEKQSILFGGSKLLVEELIRLKHLNALTITLTSFHALQRILSSLTLQSSTPSLCPDQFQDSKSVDDLSLANLRRLETLQLWECLKLEDCKIEYSGEAKNIRVTHGFQSLHKVYIRSSPKVRHMTWLVFAPNLKDIGIECCKDIEEIIKLDEVPVEGVENLIPFTRLQFLLLRDFENLKSFYSNPLPFPHLKEISVNGCPKLMKLPLDCNNRWESKFIIKREYCWWQELQWDNEATQNSCIQKI